MKVIGIIPARYASTRFPGKLLAPILGKTLIQRTYESAKKSKVLDKLVIATDDERIAEHARDFGAEVYMTSISCLNGTERLVDAIKRYPELGKGDIFINIQGDVPCIPASSIDDVATLLIENPREVMATLVKKLHDPKDITNPSVVKCVLDSKKHALYFSRSVIPGSKKQDIVIETPYYGHIGLYGFRKDFLLKYVELENTPLQLHEDLEQLKVLEHGFRIITCEAKDVSFEVDMKEDIHKVEQWLCTQNISS